MSTSSVSVRVSASMPEGTDYLEGQIFLNFDCGSRVGLDFKGRGFERDDETFFIELYRSGLRIPLFRYQGPLAKDFWDRASLANVSLLMVLKSPLVDAETQLLDPESAGIAAVKQMLSAVISNSKLEVTFRSLVYTIAMNAATERLVRSVLFPSN